MYIPERLIGVGTFFLMLMAVCCLLIKSKHSPRLILTCYTAVLVFMGFLYKPYITSDLHRIYESMDVFAEFGVLDFFKKYVITSTTPAARLLYWLVAKTGVYSLLPAIAAGVTYPCIFYIVLRTAERYKVKRVDIALTVLFLMSTGSYMMVISNIRTMMAASMICLCFFRESIEKKFSKWHVALYVLAATLHNVGLIVLAIRLAFLIPKLNIKRKQLPIIAGATAAIVLLFWLIAPGLMNRFLVKIQEYLFGETYSYGWEYLSGGVVMALEYWIVYKCRDFPEKRSQLWRENWLFLLTCLLIACGLCWSFAFYIRFSTFVAPILAAPLLMLVLRKDTKKNRKIVFVMSMVALFLACARGQLCSYKYFIFPWNS